MVEQDDAKKMGYAEYNVFKKLRAEFRKRGKKSDEIFRKLKTLLKNGWEGKKTLEKLSGSAEAGTSASEEKPAAHKDSGTKKSGEKKKKEADKKKKEAEKKK